VTEKKCKNTPFQSASRFVHHQQLRGHINTTRATCINAKPDNTESAEKHTGLRATTKLFSGRHKPALVSSLGNNIRTPLSAKKTSTAGKRAAGGPPRLLYFHHIEDKTNKYKSVKRRLTLKIVGISRTLLPRVITRYMCILVLPRVSRGGNTAAEYLSPRPRQAHPRNVSKALND